MERTEYEGAELVMPDGLKAMGRIIEKSLLRVDDSGNADQIFDVVRCMAKCKDMRQAAEVVRRVNESASAEDAAEPEGDMARRMRLAACA